MTKNIFLLLITLAFSVLSCQNSETELAEVGKDLETTLPAGTISNLETDQDLDILLNEIGDSRYVLLGEASHGTSEYYTWRAKITQRLIHEKGFTVIRQEGDWPDLYKLNQYIKGNTSYGTSAGQVLQTLDRWPTWMWANQEVADLGEWLRSHNQAQSSEKQVSFYGLDVYSLWDSLREVQAYLEETDPAAAEKARAALACFAPYNEDEYAYAGDALNGVNSCADELQEVLATVQAKVKEAHVRNEAAFNALQNAIVAVNAERYYDVMTRSNTSSWNIRDRHMAETITNLVQHHGAESKIIVWEHNTHVGDARATDMVRQGTVNVGQLIREQHSSEGVYIVGFGSYSGTVIAASIWGDQRKQMKVPEAKPDSWEALLHTISPANKLIITKGLKENKTFMQEKGHRAIGVVYHPSAESSNYVPTVLPNRYDAFLFIDQTHALHPLATSLPGKKAPEHQPVGVGDNANL